MSEDSAGYDLNQILDTRPLPDSEAAELIDGTDSTMQPMTDVQRFAAAVGIMPPELAHAICRAIGRLDSFENIADIARVSGVSTTTIYDYIARAGIQSKKLLKAPPGIGSPTPNGGGSGVRRGLAQSETNAAKAAKMLPKSPKKGQGKSA